MEEFFNHSLNFKLIRQKLGLSQQALANALCEKQAKIRDIETGKQKIPIELALKIENFYNVNFKWLLTGEGEIFRDTERQETTYQLPIRGEVEASLGYGVSVYNENITSTYSISKKFADDLGINPKMAEIIYARGDSMEPNIFGGDSILVDKSKTTIHDGVIYCIRLDGEPLIKRLQRLAPDKIGIISDNPKYRMREVILNENNIDDFNIIGEVCWWGRIAK